MPAETPERTQTLRAATTLGRRAGAAAAARGEPPAPAQPVACPAPPTVAVGVMTGPSNLDRRERLRGLRRLLLRSPAQLCAVTFTFILGDHNKLLDKERTELAAENRTHGDLLFTPLPESSTTCFHKVVYALTVAASEGEAADERQK